MAIFRAGVPIETAESVISVDATPDRPLPVGRHTFQLEVVDDSGNRSDPDRVVVIVRDETNPTAVLDAPKTVGFGLSFPLSGKQSSDPPPGKIVRYIWTLVD
ncbi:MAG: hypothetical protein OEY86_02385 [Nitrospira sp.]|nr:hypothetical protein [Nitrospira sp.]